MVNSDFARTKPGNSALFISCSSCLLHRENNIPTFYVYCRNIVWSFCVHAHEHASTHVGIIIIIIIIIIITTIVIIIIIVIVLIIIIFIQKKHLIQSMQLFYMEVPKKHWCPSSVIKSTKLKYRNRKVYGNLQIIIQCRCLQNVHAIYFRPGKPMYVIGIYFTDVTIL